jgi:hypothetical protein
MGGERRHARFDNFTYEWKPAPLDDYLIEKLKQVIKHGMSALWDEYGDVRHDALELFQRLSEGNFQTHAQNPWPMLTELWLR